MDIQYNRYNKKKHFVQAVMFTLFRLFSYSIAAILFCILGFILVKGFHTISWEFITQAPSDGMTKGGIWPAIVGTCCLMAGSAIFSFPIGVISGIYMNEYAPKGKLVNFIRMMTKTMIWTEISAGRDWLSEWARNSRSPMMRPISTDLYTDMQWFQMAMYLP